MYEQTSASTLQRKEEVNFSLLLVAVRDVIVCEAIHPPILPTHKHVVASSLLFELFDQIAAIVSVFVCCNDV